MAKYSDLTDYTDDALTMNETLLTNADTHVDSILRDRGIDPSDVTLPNELLTRLAVVVASWLASLEQAIGEDSPLMDKAKMYKQLMDELSKSISRTSLGLSYPTGSGYAAVNIGRA